MRRSLGALLCLLLLLGPAAAEDEKGEDPNRPAKEMTEEEKQESLTEAESANKRLIALYRAGKYAEAIPDGRKALALRQRALGPDHPDVATSLNNLALLLDSVGSYDEARPLYERALAIREKALGPDHPDVALSLNNLAQLLSSVGSYGEARVLHERALKIREKTLGPGHPHAAMSLNNLACLLTLLGSYEEARPLYERALAIYEEILGPDHPHVATNMSNLAYLLTLLGSYEEARSLYERALKIREKVLGPDHPEVAKSLNNLAHLLTSLGSYEGARPFFERALAIYEATLGPDHRDVAMGLNNLASLLGSLGSYEEARPLHERALKIREKTLGPDHPDVATSFNNLGHLLMSLGSYEEARPLFERALAIYQETLGPDHPHVAMTLNNLASLHVSLGSYEEAQPLHDHALRIREKTLGPDHPDVATSLNNLALLLDSLGSYDEARPLYERALAIREKALGPDHPDVATSLNNLALQFEALGQKERAAPLLERALQVSKRFARRGFSAVDAHNRLQLLRRLRDQLDNWVGFTPLVGRSAYPEVLQVKGLVARAEIAERILARRGDEEARKRGLELQAAERRVAKLANSMPARFPEPETLPQRLAKWREEYARASAKREALALALQRDYAPLTDALERLDLTIGDIQARLGPDAVLVDTLRSAGSYVAWIVRSVGEAQRVDLGDAEKLEEAAALFAADAEDADATQEKRRASGRALRDLLWAPIEKRLGKGVRRVCLSPDAALATVPFGALPSSSGKPGSLLADEYLFSNVSSAQDLVPWEEDVPTGAGALLLGDVRYKGPGVEQDAGPAVAKRGHLTPRAPRGGTYHALPGTALEIAALKEKLGASAVMLQGGAATEAAVRAGAKGKRVVHLATHGFVRTNLMRGLQEKREKASEARRWMGAGMERQLAGGHDPMSLAGLALAGANLRQGGGDDDGILTALEASHLDLDSADLVVLSACQTALGTPAAGEGVLGLIRGFQMAGAPRVIGSLWKVDDDATRALMVKFHELWTPSDVGKPMGAAEALRAAQQHVRSQEKWAHPYYWAAWVLWGLPE